MDPTTLEEITELFSKHRSTYRRETDEVQASLTDLEKQKALLEGRVAEDSSDSESLRELSELGASISQDRWRRKWLDHNLETLDRIECAIQERVVQGEMTKIESDLKRVRADQEKLEREEIPSLEAKLGTLRGKIPVLQATLVELTDRLAELRKKAGGKYLGAT